MVYGYCRISTGKQNIERQERNIKAAFPDAIILKEVYTGSNNHNRPVFAELVDRVISGDVIVFDDATRMSRSGTEGSHLYFQLFCRGVELVFLKTPQMNTSVVKEAVMSTVVSVFEQAEKEVADLHQRTKEGIETARLHGKQIGGQAGRKLNVKKKAPSKEKIRKYSRDFDGMLNDAECMKLIGLARNTYYKYKRELKMYYRQMEGIKIAQNAGRMGRPRVPMTEHIWDVMAAWQRGDLSGVEAINASRLSKATFYRLAKANGFKRSPE